MCACLCLWRSFCFSASCTFVKARLPDLTPGLLHGLAKLVAKDTLLRRKLKPYQRLPGLLSLDPRDPTQGLRRMLSLFVFAAFGALIGEISEESDSSSGTSSVADPASVERR